MNNANQPAYPCEQGTDPNGNWNQTFEPGLSKREYIAALALQATICDVFGRWKIDDYEVKNVIE